MVMVQPGVLRAKHMVHIRSVSCVKDEKHRSVVGSCIHCK